MKRRATVETLDDIVNSIRSFGDVSVVLDEFDGVAIDAWPYAIRAKPHEPMFHWTLQAKDDPSDFDEGYASDPLDAVLESLSEDTPAGDLWKQHASTPRGLSKLLRAMAASDAKEAASLLKRVAGFLEASDPGSMLLELHRKEVEKVAEEARRRRWRASVEEGPGGLPAIEFEIGERYAGIVELSHMTYDYKFEVDGFPEVAEEGTTDAVVRSLKEWVRSKKVGRAADEASTERPRAGDGGPSPLPTVRS